MEISGGCLIRLLGYKNALNRYKELGFTKTYSQYLAETVGVTSAQVRKDFSTCKIAGKKRGGYSIESVLHDLDAIIGMDSVHKVVLVGAGNLGSALMQYRGFMKEGFEIAAAFDIDPYKCHKKSSYPILPLDQLTAYVQEHKIVTGILAVPESVAQQVLDVMVSAGIEGVLNFAPCWLRFPRDNVIVTNVNLAQELEKLICQLRLRKIDTEAECGQSESLRVVEEVVES